MNPENIKIDIESRQEVAPEAIKEIEDSAFGLNDKASILLVKAGLKPAALLYLETLGGEEEITDQQILACKKLLQDFGTSKEGRHFNEAQKLKSGRTAKTETIEFLIGSTQENLHKLSLAMENNNEHEIGLALGYCPTAVDAYCGNGELLDESELWDQSWAREAMIFKPSKLSAEYFKDELEHYQKWADFVKKTSPSIYKQMMGNLK